MKLVRTLTSAALAGSALLTFASPSHAQPADSAATQAYPPCVGAACNGLSPGACATQNSQWVETVFPTGASVTLRYNPDCRAVWAEIWGFNGAEAWVENTNGDKQSVTITNNLNAVTKMINDKNIKAKACGKASGGGTVLCTSSF